MEIDNKIPNLTGIRIKEMRLENNWTQKDLANRLGLKNETAIANYESGYSLPKDEIKSKMCEIFNCTMDYLMGESEFKNIDNAIDSYQKNQYESDVNNALSSSAILFLKADLDTSHMDIVKTILLSDNSDEYKGNALGDFVNTFSGTQKTLVKKAIEFILDFISHEQERRHIYSNLLNIKLKLNSSKDNTKLYILPILGKITAGQPILADENIEGYLPTDPNIYHLSVPDNYFYLRVSGNSMNKVVKDGSYVLVEKQDYADDGDIIVAIVNGDNEATLKKYKKINNELIVMEPQSDDPNFEPIYIDKNTNFKIIGKAIGYFGKF